MDIRLIIIIVIPLLVLGLAVLVFLVRSSGSRTSTSNLSGLMGRNEGDFSELKKSNVGQSDDEIEKIKQAAGKAQFETSSRETMRERLFAAGIFSHKSRQKFFYIRAGSIIVGLVVVPLVMFLTLGGMLYLGLGFFLGGLIAYSGPNAYLERVIKRRHEDIMYFLPLVIEQISIGVGSALDIGPCISHILEMADERDSHNPVTELFVHVDKLLRSGLNLEDSLVEIGQASGMNEVKHAFMFLAQCARHGGELSRQLQELADSVMVQKQNLVEARITKLPVDATMPLATVFAGFFGLLFAGLFTRLSSTLGTLQ